MKRTCNDCKALDTFGCSLRYKTKKSYVNTGILGMMERWKPLEECPKPKTNKELLKCIKEKG